MVLLAVALLPINFTMVIPNTSLRPQMRLLRQFLIPALLSAKTESQSLSEPIIIIFTFYNQG